MIVQDNRMYLNHHNANGILSFSNRAA